jgi:hypothetical protein
MTLEQVLAEMAKGGLSIHAAKELMGLSLTAEAEMAIRAKQDEVMGEADRHYSSVRRVMARGF